MVYWFIFSGIRFQVPEYLSQSHQQIQVSIQFSCFNRFAVIIILSFVSEVFFSPVFLALMGMAVIGCSRRGVPLKEVLLEKLSFAMMATVQVP